MINIYSVGRSPCSSVGVNDAGGPPVPIPNTEVKPGSAEDTWLETTWENREMPTFCFYFIGKKCKIFW